MESNDQAEILRTPTGREYVRTPDSCFENLEGYPYTPSYVEVDGLRVHYVDEGPADGGIVLEGVPMDPGPPMAAAAKQQPLSRCVPS